MFFKKNSKKKILVLVIITILVVFLASRLFKKEEAPFDVFEVVRGDVVKELWETGRIHGGETISLSFKTAGEIEEIYVGLNQIVEKGDILVKLNTGDSETQLEEAQLSLELTLLNLEKLLEGASPEEIQIAQTRLEGAEVLSDGSQENLQKSYEAAVTVLNSLYPQFDDVSEFIEDLVEDYVVVYDPEGRDIIRAKDEIVLIKDKIKPYWDIARGSKASHQDIDTAILIMRSSLEENFENLQSILEIIKESINYDYKDKISATDRALLDNLIAGTNNALANIISSQQAITSAKLSLKTARVNLQEARDALALIQTGASKTDLALQEIQIKQAQNRVDFYANQIKEMTLRSPFKSRVTAINKREGERVMALETAITLVPLAPFEISVDIYEEDIVKIEIGAPAKIILPALPEEITQGTVVFIDESEKIVEGIVYYEIKIAPDQDLPRGIRSTMTADIIIETEKREDVLTVPRGALQGSGDKTIIEVLVGGLVQKKEVEIGLRGDDKIEIISGLTEGETVVIR